MRLRRSTDKEGKSPVPADLGVSAPAYRVIWVNSGKIQPTDCAWALTSTNMPIDGVPFDREAVSARRGASGVPSGCRSIWAK